MDNDKNNSSESEWTTWQELLLAYAVHRHGTSDWNSVADEIRKRNSGAAVTSVECLNKYADLKKRYGEEEKWGSVPWIEKLKTTRVLELRRDLQRCDLSILSLQLK